MASGKPKDEMIEKKMKEQSGKKPAGSGAPTAVKRKQIEGVRGIVRLADSDLDGTKKIKSALPKIKGVGPSLAVALARALNISETAYLGSLTDEQIANLEKAIQNPQSVGIPKFFLDRQADPFLGGDRHLISSDLSFTRKSDIDFMKKMHMWKGIRHEQGQPVRGQRTRGNFRTGKAMGVSKAKLAPAKAAPAGAPAAGAAPATGGKAPAPAAGAKPGAAPAPAGKAPAPAGKPTAKPEEKKK